MYRSYSQALQQTIHKAEVWRLLVGLVLAVAVMGLIVFAVFGGLSFLMDAKSFYPFLESLGAGKTATGDMALLFAFGSMGLGTICASKVLHGRGLGKLIGSWGLALRQFAQVFALLLALNLVLWFFIWSPDATMALPMGRWAMLLPLTLLALLIQIGSEELLFRGYMQSQLAARFASPLVWMLIPSVLFGAVHYAPELYGQNAIWIVVWAGTFGLAAADITARAKTLGAALAMHFANNIFAVAVVSMPGDLSQLALFNVPYGPADAEQVRAQLPFGFLSIFLMWLVTRIAIRA